MAIPLGHFDALILATACGFVQRNSLKAALPMADKPAAPESHMVHDANKKQGLGALVSNSKLLPGPSGPAVETASRPDLKPKRFAVCRRSRSFASTADSSSGQAMCVSKRPAA